MSPAPEVRIVHGDSEEALAQMDPESVHAVVTDPDYAIDVPGGEAWIGSGTAYRPEFWAAVHRVLVPGGHLLAFGAPRTWHRLAVAIEDGGFEIRDSFAWLYGSGFPKSHDVSKAIDKTLGVEREITGQHGNSAPAQVWRENGAGDVARPPQERRDAPATAEAQKWDGWGTGLKPAHEPVVVARKPPVGTVAKNVLEYGTGALNLQASRIGADPIKIRNYIGLGPFDKAGDAARMPEKTVHGRWPTNVLLDESQAEVLDAQTPKSGGASKFFYTAKAFGAERSTVDGVTHPTNKPVELMKYLVRLVTPPGGVVLDPFAGSGTTAEACVIEGFDCVVMEREAKYLPLIQHRIERASEQTN